ncbi:MAG TPA: hypothetical protein VK604_06715, partial [Bryobacteraceae bacterium]|nr:hypothetical protein [Bryobacteraceae bacterium]
MSLTLDSAIADSSIVHQAIDRSADPQRVAHYLQEFGARHAAEFQALKEDPQRLHWLAEVFGVSRFLSEELLRHPDWLGKLDDLRVAYSRDDYKERLDEFLGEHGVMTATALDLALFRRRELVRIVLRDRLGIGTLAEIAGELSNLADTVLARVLAGVTAEMIERHGRPVTQCEGADNGVPAALTLLALGKLGGSELNYSSDVDLMFLYSANGETSGPKVISNKEFFKKVANQFTNLLSTHTAAGLCYRVDLRLRPEGTLGEVCISLDAAKQYYSKRARDWELQMLIKARGAAGDEALGQALLDFVEPSIYSTTLDFSTIETMSETRERITEKLASKRLGKAQLDVKLARGGIRDVEFLVQCLQRLHGAREMHVRQGGTLLALAHLHEKDLLSTTEHTRLVDAYEYFRRLEHLLQLEDDRQTHALPSNPLELERLARRMNGPLGMPAAQREAGTSAAGQLLRNLHQRLENVQVIYERIVHAQRPPQYSQSSIGESTASVAPIDPERSGLEVSGAELMILDRMAPRFMASLRARGVHRARRKLADFLESLSNELQQLELLDNHPVLADWMIQVFELSPYLGDQLSRYPELLEEIRRAADHPTRRWAFEGLAAPLS